MEQNLSLPTRRSKLEASSCRSINLAFRAWVVPDSRPLLKDFLFCAMSCFFVPYSFLTCWRSVWYVHLLAGVPFGMYISLLEFRLVCTSPCWSSVWYVHLLAGLGGRWGHVTESSKMYIPSRTPASVHQGSKRDTN